MNVQLTNTYLTLIVQ